MELSLQRASRLHGRRRVWLLGALAITLGAPLSVGLAEIPADAAVICPVETPTALATALVASSHCTTIQLTGGFTYDEQSVGTPLVVPSASTPSNPMILDLEGFSFTINDVANSDAGIEVPTGNALTIQDSKGGGTLSVSGGSGDSGNGGGGGGAGIGGNGGIGGINTVVAGDGGSCGSVTIAGGTITPTGGAGSNGSTTGGGAGIGGGGGGQGAVGGNGGGGGTVTLTGGTITTPTGGGGGRGAGSGGAGIGGGGGGFNGNSGGGGTVTVTGGTITSPTGGAGLVGGGGAGIGGGGGGPFSGGGDGGTVAVTGGTITSPTGGGATTGTGAGIGGGSGGAGSSNGSGGSGGTLVVASTANVNPGIAGVGFDGGQEATITVTLPNGTPGVAYSTTLSETGGSPPFSFSLASGSLPPGLKLSSTGVITGVPTSSGTPTFVFTVQVSDPSPLVMTAYSIHICGGRFRTC